MTHFSKLYGPPGTGKTTKLVGIVREELEKDPRATRSIAYLSYTRAAADDAFDRVSKFSSTKSRPRWFCTVHAAAARSIGLSHNHIWSLRHWHELAQATSLKFRDSRSLDAEGWDDEGCGDPIINCINVANSRMVSTDEILPMFQRYPVVNATNVAMVKDAMDFIKKQHGVYDFDDILMMYNNQNPKPLPVKLFLVDEAQDLSRLQWQVVRKMWHASDRVIVAGDDDQVLYEQMGVESGAFLNFEADHEEVLPLSHRVPGNIGALADRIITQVSERKAKHVQWKAGDGEIKVIFSNLLSLPVKADEDTLILCRHNDHARRIYRHLMNEGFPCALGNESYLTDEEAKVCKVFWKLRDGEEVTATEAIDMLSAMPGREHSIERLRFMRSQGKSQKFRKEQFDLDFSKPVSIFGATMQQDRRFNSIAWAVKHYGEGIVGQRPKVRIMTMHASKGLEADHVFIITDVFPIVWETQDGVSLDAERRLSYVAVTRSRSRLTIVMPNTSMYTKRIIEAVQ